MMNYMAIINRFFVVPIIYPRKNTNMERIEANLVPPLGVWAGNGYLLDIWKKIRQELLRRSRRGKGSEKNWAESRYYSIL